jgi:heptosyltransferase-2
MDWINSCKIIISQDSLGLHVALAYDRKIIGLFGPTDSSEIYTYGKDNIIIHSGQACDKMPCYSPNCITDLYCMEKIDLDEIMNAVRKLMDSA